MVHCTNYVFLRDQGAFYGDGSTGTAVTYGVGDLMSVAFDTDNNKLYIAKNGAYLNGGNPSQGTGFTHSGINFVGGYTPIVSDGNINQKFRLNCGQKPFKFPPPDGFQPLNDANVRPETVITRPDQYVGITTWKGDDQASHVINDLNFDGVPDFVWIKRRDGNAAPHQLYDTIRGATKPLQSSATSSEDTQPTGLKAFVRNGFELGASSTVNGLDGDNGNVPFNYVAWCWKANGGNKNTFNVDDVGYANASDVNMSVGALNSASYNQTQNWSAGGGSGLYSGSTWGPVFDGIPAVDGHNIAHSAYVTNNGSSTLTFSTAISGVLTVKTCQGSDSTSSGTSRPYVQLSNGQTIRVDGGTSNPTTHSFGEVSNITSLTINGTSAQGMNLIFVKLDGKLLVDSGVTPPNAPSIAPTGASVNTKSKFGIYTWNGHGSSNETLVPHRLGAQPDFMICKKKSTGGNNWVIWHKSMGVTKYLMFTTAGVDTDSTLFNSHTNDSDNLWSLGTNNSISATGQSAVAYLWCDVPISQKFGLYVGNNTSAPNGPFVELGSVQH